MQSATEQKSAPASNKKSQHVSPPPAIWPGALGLLLLTLLVYIPSYKAGFIWDDDVIAGHPLMREGWHGLRDIWFSIRYGDFCPLTATSFWIEWQIHGGMKEIQHATNIVLQALNVVLLWRVLAQLRIPGAWLAAAVFAVHPVCVASVTWLAERKNTLSMFFYLLSLLLWLRSENKDETKATSHFNKAAYWFSFVFFLFGLLSKTAVVVLPVVMLLCAWWRDGKIDRRNLMQTAPFFAFAFAAGVATLVAHFYFGPKLGVLPTETNGFTRILTAGRAFWFYIGKDLLPIGLTLHYPGWKISPTAPLDYVPGLAIIGMLGLFWKFRQSWGKACLFGVGYFILAVGPTIGVVNMAFLMMAPVADHLQYLALPGIIALVAGGGFYILQKKFPAAQKTLPALLCLLFVAPLAALSWKHQSIMANPEALWRDNLKKHPTSWTAHNNLAGLLFDKREYEESARLYREALKARDNLSMVHVNYGRALFALGKTDEAIGRYYQALKVDPTDFKAHNNLGVAFITMGRTNEAIGCFQKAVELSPTDFTFFSNLARLYIESGRTRSAIELFRQRLQQNPSDYQAHNEIAKLYFQEGELNEAQSHFQHAIQMKPDFAEARFGLAEILARQSKTAEAIEQWRQVLKLRPDSLQVIGNLAWALATDRNPANRNGKEAVAYAEQALAIAGKTDPRYLDLLAAAYAESGRLADAVRTAGDAVSAAEVAQQRELATVYRSRLKLYEKGTPYHNQ